MQRLGKNEAREPIPSKVVEDLMLAIVLLVCVDVRARVSSPVVASDASGKVTGVVRTHSITAVGRHALAEFQSAALLMEGRLGLIEFAPNAGTTRQALANLSVRPAVHAAVRLSGSNKRSLELAWQDAFFVQYDEGIGEAAS